MLPRIGDVEAAFFAGGRVQRKIWRIELRQGRALIDVERSDAARCLGIVALGTVHAKVDARLSGVEGQLNGIAAALEQLAELDDARFS